MFFRDGAEPGLGAWGILQGGAQRPDSREGAARLAVRPDLRFQQIGEKSVRVERFELERSEGRFGKVLQVVSDEHLGASREGRGHHVAVALVGELDFAQVG